MECNPPDQRPPKDCPLNGPASPTGVADSAKGLAGAASKALGASDALGNAIAVSVNAVSVGLKK